MILITLLDILQFSQSGGWSIHACFHPGLRLCAIVMTAGWGWVLASTPRSFDSVIAAMAHGQASFSWEVAQQTGEEQGQERDGGPANAAVRLRTGARLVRAGVLIVIGAVVEKALDAADACSVLHGVVW